MYPTSIWHPQRTRVIAEKVLLFTNRIVSVLWAISVYTHLINNAVALQITALLRPVTNNGATSFAENMLTNARA